MDAAADSFNVSGVRKQLSEFADIH
jgi:hypothetical protein